MLEKALTDADGRYTAEGLGDPRVVLSVHGPNPVDGRHVRHASLVQPVEAGSGPVVVQVDPRMGSISAVMVDAAGQPVTGGFVRCHRLGFGHRDTELLDRDGRFAYASLPAGEYALEIGGRRLPLLHRTVTVAPGAATDLGRIRWPVGIALEVELRDAAGEPLGPDAKPRLQIVSTAPATPATGHPALADLNRVEGQPLWRSSPVLAGPYRLTVAGTGIGPFARDIELREGAANRLALRCRRGLAQQIAVVPPPASAAREDELSFSIRIRTAGPDGALLVDHRFSGTLSPDRTVATTVELLPGHYVASVYGESGQSEVSFAVPEAGGTRPLRVALR